MPPLPRISLLSYTPHDYPPMDGTTSTTILKKRPTDLPTGKPYRGIFLIESPSSQMKLAGVMWHKSSQATNLQIFPSFIFTKVICFVSGDVKPSISYQPIDKQKQSKKWWSQTQTSLEDVMTYLEPPRPHNMPIFTLLLSTSASTCQDPSGPASW